MLVSNVVLPASGKHPSRDDLFTQTNNCYFILGFVLHSGVSWFDVIIVTSDVFIASCVKTSHGGENVREKRQQNGSLLSTSSLRILHFAKLRRSLNPCGSSVPSLRIQKSSLFKSRCRVCSFVILRCDISSMTISLKSLSKSWPGSRKCLSMLMESVLFASFRCLFIRLLVPWDSTFPTYCLSLHLLQKPR